MKPALHDILTYILHASACGAARMASLDGDDGKEASQDLGDKCAEWVSTSVA